MVVAGCCLQCKGDFVGNGAKTPESDGLPQPAQTIPPWFANFGQELVLTDPIGWKSGFQERSA